MDPLIGKMLGPYKIVARLGEGGMAVVYKGYQESLGRYVAIKVLRGELARDPEFISRFRREALSAARLSHPNILPVYDAGMADGAYYIAMDYASGSLRDLIAQGPLPTDQAASIAAQLADALDYAHRQGLIHRDIKPSNVLLGQDGRPLIADFGIARALYETSRLTRTGTFLGTPEYMAPEQAEGQPADGRADLYALGIVLYEMLTGTVPFAAETPAATLYRQVHELPPPVRWLNANVPTWLESVVAKALAKHPDERYQNGSDLAAALRWTGSATQLGYVPPAGSAAAPKSPGVQQKPSVTPSAGGVQQRPSITSPTPAVRQAPPPTPRVPVAQGAAQGTSRSGRSGLVIALLALAGCLLIGLLAGGLYLALGGGKPTAEVTSLPTAMAADITNAAPAVTVLSPTSGLTVARGETVNVQSQASDDKGVIRLELWADGQLARSDASASTAGQTPFQATQPWRADVEGSHTLSVKAYDAEGQVTESAPLIVHVQAPGTTPATEQPTAGPTEPGATEAPTASPTEQPAADTPTATPTASPTASATPTASPTASATPTPTPTVTPTPACPIGTDGELAAGWDRAKLGCPTAGSAVVWAAWEPFVHGYMLWRSDTDWAYVFDWQGGSNPAAGTWVTGGDSWKWDGSFPEGHGLTPPAGRYEPIRGFGFVWFSKLGGTSGTLGWATDQEKGFCAKVQPFEQGFIFRSNTVEFCEDEYFNWARDPSFTPLFFAIAGDGSWQAVGD